METSAYMTCIKFRILSYSEQKWNINARVNIINDADSFSLWLRWDVAVGREAAGVYQQSISPTERDPETD